MPSSFLSSFYYSTSTGYRTQVARFFFFFLSDGRLERVATPWQLATMGRDACAAVEVTVPDKQPRVRAGVALEEE